MNKYVVVCVLGFALAACTTADEGSDMAMSAPQAAPIEVAENTNQDAANETDEDAEICRRVPRTGSRFHTTICRTQSEWEREAEEARDASQALQRNIEPPCSVNRSC